MRATTWRRCALLAIFTAGYLFGASSSVAQLDEEMQSMESKHQTRQPPAINRAVTAIRQSVTTMVSSLYRATMNSLSGPDMRELDQMVLDDPDSYSLNTRLWAEARTEANEVADALHNFPFPHFYSAPGVIGDYMENGLGRAINQIIQNDDDEN